MRNGNSRTDAMPQPPLDDETTLSGNIPLIGEDMGWFSSFFLSLNHPSQSPTLPSTWASSLAWSWSKGR